MDDRVTCKGSFALGTACGWCWKCKIDKNNPINKVEEETPNNTQQNLMIHDPVAGTTLPYPSHAQQYREYHGLVAWLYNPWTGDKRDARDIGSDVEGYGIQV